VKRQSKNEDRVSQRAQQLFKLLVERYLYDGSPVASKVLAQQPGVEVSPATVRNIMADLEARGLVESPHTSAGKVPTTIGLRFFVDSLLSVQPIEHENLERLHQELNPDLTPSRLIEQASQLLSGITQMAGLVTLPKAERVSLRHVEFLGRLLHEYPRGRNPVRRVRFCLQDSDLEATHGRGPCRHQPRESHDAAMHKDLCKRRLLLRDTGLISLKTDPLYGRTAQGVAPAGDRAGINVSMLTTA